MRYFVYIASNKRQTVFYTGITNNIERRMFEHASKSADGFTKKYNIDTLLYYEEFGSPLEAIEAEKRVKDWRREKKRALIKSLNPEFMDLLQE